MNQFEYIDDNSKGISSGPPRFAKIIFVQEDEQITNMYVLDEYKKRYLLEHCCIISEQYAEDQYSVRFPKPYIIDNSGKILQEGATIIIQFPEGRNTPIIIGCVNQLLLQEEVSSKVAITKLNLFADITYKKNSNGFEIYSISDEKGDQVNLVKGDFIRNVINGNMIFTTNKNATFEGKELLNLLGNEVEIGGNNDFAKETADNEKNKAENTNIYAKKICLGHSNKRGKEILIDEDNKYLTPKLQNAVMGVTLKKLLEILIDDLVAATWIGSGIVARLSFNDGEKIKADVKNKLDLILSDVVSLLYKSNEVE
jgi:hypothetical protein